MQKYFCCKTTTKTSDHNHARDILCDMTKALGFVTHKEVVVYPWAKKPDVELLDPSGEFLTFYLDVTLPALHQEAIDHREGVFANARKLKAKEYPRKDASGRLLTESACVPFILSSMGGLCKEGHDFLKLCKKKDPTATQWMIDVLVTQHSKWTARRVRRALFGQSIVDFKADPWTGVHSKRDSKAAGAQKRTKKKQSRLEREFSQGESQSSRVSSSQSCEETIRQPSEVTVAGSSSDEQLSVPREERPNGTVYFSDGEFFQDFSGFQKQHFQSHFRNESHTQEQFSQQVFSNPLQQDLL